MVMRCMGPVSCSPRAAGSAPQRMQSIHVWEPPRQTCIWAGGIGCALVDAAGHLDVLRSSTKAYIRPSPAQPPWCAAGLKLAITARCLHAQLHAPLSPPEGTNWLRPFNAIT